MDGVYERGPLERDRDDDTEGELGAGERRIGIPGVAIREGGRDGGTIIGVEQRDSGSIRKYCVLSDDGVLGTCLYAEGDSGVSGEGGLSLPGFKVTTGDAGLQVDAREPLLCESWNRLRIEGARARFFGEKSSFGRLISGEPGRGTEPIFGVVGRDSLPPLKRDQGDMGLGRAGRYRPRGGMVERNADAGMQCDGKAGVSKPIRPGWSAALLPQRSCRGTEWVIRKA